MFVFSYCVFFFKQKTAYEMRISDWSSDVCSSDLGQGVWLNITSTGEVPSALLGPDVRKQAGDAAIAASPASVQSCLIMPAPEDIFSTSEKGAAWDVMPPSTASVAPVMKRAASDARNATGSAIRSEEHTSELQSLMRISYAAFCLKKKKN